jgi:hypothetical protein|nr:MAG TPA: 43 kDa tail protein [Caudoviricetes sp.]
MDYELLIQHGNKVYQPIVTGEIQWQTERKGVQGSLTFKVVKDATLNFTEGDSVRLKVDGKKVFYGFVFQKKRNKDGIITVTAYDQLRYLKNKDTYVYSNKTASEVVQMLAKDFNLQCGTMEDTKFKIESRVEDNQTLFDIIQNALDLTLQNKKEMYVLYDDFGKLTLKNIGNMKVGILIDEDTGENFDYTSSIDGETYNKIKLVYNNEKTGKRETYIAQDSSHINQWGVLQYFETIDEKTNGKAKADALLSLYNQKTRNLTIKGAFGDVRVRAGTLVAVSLNLGDIIANSFLLVEQAKHTFSESLHTMDLTLRGGEFIA